MVENAEGKNPVMIANLIRGTVTIYEQIMPTAVSTWQDWNQKKELERKGSQVVR